MLQRLYNLEENVQPKNLFCGQAKFDIYDTLYLADKFCKRQILICRHDYDEIDQEGCFDGNIVDCQHEYRFKVKKEMEYQKRRFLKQDSNREKKKTIKKFLKTIKLDENEDEDEDYSINSSASIQKPLKFQKISTGRARAKVMKKKLFKKNLFRRKDTYNPGQDMPQDQ